MIPNSLQFAFFGTDEFSVIVLEELLKAGFIPALIVTAPDRPAGRGMELTPPPVTVWARKVYGNSIGIREQILQPEKLDQSFVSTLNANRYTLFIVASYGKIIPKQILDIPKHGSLNVHPSLLPLYRGASPIQSQILDGAEQVGVTIMLMDEKMDHGPIVAQQEWEIRNPKSEIRNKSQIQNSKSQTLGIYMKYEELRDELAKLGGKLLAETIPKWIAGEIEPREQNHAKATYTKKIAKEDGLINLEDNPELNYRKFLAYGDWPSVYFFQNGKRIKITDAEYKNGKFIIRKIVPEGKKEMRYEDFFNG